MSGMVSDSTTSILIPIDRKACKLRCWCGHLKAFRLCSVRNRKGKGCHWPSSPFKLSENLGLCALFSCFIVRNRVKRHQTDSNNSICDEPGETARRFLKRLFYLLEGPKKKKPRFPQIIRPSTPSVPSTSQMKYENQLDCPTYPLSVPRVFKSPFETALLSIKLSHKLTRPASCVYSPSQHPMTSFFI